MVSESALQKRILAHILAPLFGLQVAHIAVQLLRLQGVRAGATMASLCFHSRHAARGVREALQLLILHNMVQALAVREDQQQQQMYWFDFRQAVMRLAMPRLLVYVRDTLGEGHAQLVEHVFRCGRTHEISNAALLDDLLRHGILAPVASGHAAASPKRHKGPLWYRVDHATWGRRLYVQQHFERRLADPDVLGVLQRVLQLSGDFSAVTAKLNGAALRKAFNGMPWLRRREMSSEGYYVDPKLLHDYLQFQVVHAYARTRFGPASARLLAILQAHRYGEERTLAKYAMMPAKECRERLFAMLRCGLVRLQEVPRSADHAPSRTIFLWTLAMAGQHPVQSLLLHAMVNVAERAQAELGKHRLLREKMARPDVRADASLLTETELSQTDAMESVQGRLLIQLERLLGEYVCIDYK